MRTAFIKGLIEKARSNPKIFLLVGDLGYSVVEPFAEEFPDRFLNVGIAEQNMTGVAAGLAMEGYHVFTYSIGNFPTLRCMEQIRYDVCYHNLNVTIVAVGGGYAYGPLGTSHHTTEDIGMLRTIPNLAVCAPADAHETAAITRLLCETSFSAPTYLRLGKAGEPVVHAQEISLQWGKMIRLLSGKKTAVITTGGMLDYAYQHIKQNRMEWGLYSCPFVKPLDLDTLHAIANGYEEIITMEEHQKSAGFGSAILEGLNDLQTLGKLQHIPKVKRIGIPDTFFGFAGSQQYLRKMAGLEF